MSRHRFSASRAVAMWLAVVLAGIGGVVAIGPSAGIAAEGNREAMQAKRPSAESASALHASEIQALAQVDGLIALCVQALPQQQAAIRAVLAQTLPDVSKTKAIRLRQEPSYQSAFQAIRAQSSGQDVQALKGSCSAWLSAEPVPE